MARSWWSIRVDLVGGRGVYLWPRPGRIFAASRSHTFAQLADAINAAFARWDHAHLYQFTMADGRAIGLPDLDDIEEVLDAKATKLLTLKPGERFAFEFDFGDGWTHLCTVGDERSTRWPNSASHHEIRWPTSDGEQFPTSAEGSRPTWTRLHPTPS